jgi:hypothetical protein
MSQINKFLVVPSASLILGVDPGANDYHVMRPRGPAAVDSIHHAVNLFHAIGNRKIIWINLENSRTLEFCKKHP